MPTANRRFFPRPDLLRQDQAASVKRELAEFHLSFQGSSIAQRVMSQAMQAARHTVDACTASRILEPFLMLQPSQNQFVVEWLSFNSKRPKVALRLWAWLFRFVDSDPAGNGEILVTREGLVECVLATSRSVDVVLKELVDLQALIRVREPEPGKQGRGCVRYFMNPRVGSHKPKGARDAAVSTAPVLGLVGGTDVPSERRSRAVVPAPVL